MFLIIGHSARDSYAEYGVLVGQFGVWNQVKLV